jgi:hypothetical protein
MNNSQYTSVSQIKSFLESIQHTKYDTVIPMSSLNAAEFNGGIALDASTPIERMYQGANPLPMTRNAFRNLFYRMGEAKGWAFMRDAVSPNHPVEGAALLNEMLHNPTFNSNKKGEKELFIRSRGQIQEIENVDDEDGGAIHRAIFSNQYVTLDMLQVATVVEQATNEFANMLNVDELMGFMRQQYGADVEIVNPDGGSGVGHRIERASVGIDSMSFRVRLNMKFRTEELGDFYTGLFVRTDEIGLTSVHILPYIWREICKNGMVGSYERKEVTQMRREQAWAPIIPHRWGSTEDLIYQATQATAFALAHGTSLVQKAREAAYRTIPNANSILATMLEAIVPKEQFAEATLVAGNGMEGQNTFMGIVNGITAAAHSDGLAPIITDELEAVGGTALRKFNNEATDGEITKLFFRLAKAELIQSDED